MNDTPRFVQCPNCRATIPSDAVCCFKCGHEPAPSVAVPIAQPTKAEATTERAVRPRVRFTGFGTFLFWVGIVLLGTQMIAGADWTQGTIYKLTQGFQNVNTFAFAHNYLYELGQPQAIPSLVTFVAVIPQAMALSLNGDPWSVVALVMVCVLGTWLLWDQIEENYFWIIGVPFVGGVAAWVLSNWIIHSLLWLLLVVLQGFAALGIASLPLETKLEAMHLMVEAGDKALKHSDN